MYCSTCGVAIKEGLSYCNYCGAKLGTKTETRIKSSEPKPEMLVSAMVVVFVFGLGAISVLMGVMKAILELKNGQILAFVLLSFLIMLSLEGVILKLLFRRKRGTDAVDDPVQLKRPTTNELDAVHARVLP